MDKDSIVWKAGLRLVKVTIDTVQGPFRAELARNGYKGIMSMQFYHLIFHTLSLTLPIHLCQVVNTTHKVEIAQPN